MNRYLVPDEQVTFQVGFFVCSAHYANSTGRIEVRLTDWVGMGNRFKMTLDPNFTLAEIQEVAAGRLQTILSETLEEVAVYKRDARDRRFPVVPA